MTEQQLAAIAKSIAANPLHRGVIITDYAEKALRMGFRVADVIPILDALSAEELAWLSVSPLNLLGRIKHLKRA